LKSGRNGFSRKNLNRPKMDPEFYKKQAIYLGYNNSRMIVAVWLFGVTMMQKISTIILSISIFCSYIL